MTPKSMWNGGPPSISSGVAVLSRPSLVPRSRRCVLRFAADPDAAGRSGATPLLSAAHGGHGEAAGSNGSRLA